MKKVKVIKGKDGKKPIKFKEGGLHESTHTEMGHKIPESKIRAAMSGSLGAKAKKQAMFMRNVLTGGK